MQATSSRTHTTGSMHMGFLAPLGFFLIALALPIIALYLLKRRREDVTVSSTLLWERTLRDLEANAPWQRLRRNLLLLLQLLALTLLVLGAARPFLSTAEVSSENLIIVVDTSVSMGATDVEGGTRLEAAGRRVLALFDGLPPGGRATLIRGGNGADVLVGNIDDRLALERGLAQLQPTATDSDLTAAFNLAAAAAARTSESSIVLLSDGNVQVPETLSVDVPIRFVPLGTSDENQAISALTLRQQGQGYTLFAQVTNYGSTDATRRLLLDVDGAPFTAVDLDVPPGERAERIFDLPPETTRVHARLSGSDVLPADDAFWAVPERSAARDVRLVTNGNRFLQTGLSLLPSVDLTVGRDVSDETTPDLTILDAGVDVAADDLPPGNVLLVAPAQSVDEIAVTGVLSQPVPLPATTDDPLLRFVDLSEVAILEAVATELPAWARPVIRDANSDVPLLWIGETEGRRIALLAFDLHKSDLVLRVAFPVLLANLVDALTPGLGSGVPASVRVGQPVSIPVPPNAEDVRLTTPDGNTGTLRVAGGTVVFTAEEAGIYTLATGDGPDLHVAANLFSPQESNVAPIPEPAFGSGAEEGAAEMQESRREFWPWLIAAGIFVLLVEWLASQQDGLIQVRNWTKQYTSMVRKSVDSH